jgi:hypothetical protein
MPNISWLRGQLMQETDREGVTRVVGLYLDRLHDPSFAARQEPVVSA